MSDYADDNDLTNPGPSESTEQEGGLITSRQVAEIHWLSESLGRQCPRMAGWTQEQATAEQRKLKDRIKWLDSQYGGGLKLMTNPTDEFTKAVESALDQLEVGEKAVSYPRRGRTPDTGIEDVVVGKAKALASIQAETVKLLEQVKELVAMKRTMYLTKKDVANDLEQANRDVRVRDKLRQEINGEIDQLIKDLSNE